MSNLLRVCSLVFLAALGWMSFAYHSEKNRLKDYPTTLNPDCYVTAFGPDEVHIQFSDPECAEAMYEWFNANNFDKVES